MRASHFVSLLCAFLATLTLGPAAMAQPTAEASLQVAQPFDGKSLTGWKAKENATKKSHWKVGQPALHADDAKRLVCEGKKGALVNVVDRHGVGADLFSEAKFGDCRIELEILVAQESNSGVYVMGEYEIQVLDSYGRKELRMSDMGAIYGAQPPKVNACKKPGEWQKYEITFLAPRFDASGKKVENARFVEVKLNGQVIQKDVEMKGPTPGGLTGKEAPKGPLMFQGDHGPVAYRAIRISPIAKQ